MRIVGRQLTPRKSGKLKRILLKRPAAFMQALRDHLAQEDVQTTGAVETSTSSVCVPNNANQLVREQEDLQTMMRAIDTSVNVHHSSVRIAAQGHANEENVQGLTAILQQNINDITNDEDTTSRNQNSDAPLVIINAVAPDSSSTMTDEAIDPIPQQTEDDLWLEQNDADDQRAVPDPISLVVNDEETTTAFNRTVTNGGNTCTSSQEAAATSAALPHESHEETILVVSTTNMDVPDKEEAALVHHNEEVMIVEYTAKFKNARKIDYISDLAEQDDTDLSVQRLHKARKIEK